MEDISGVGPLINIGAIGCVLAWFLIKLDPRIKSMEDAIDRNTKSMLLIVINSQTASPGLKNVAQEIIKELEESRKSK